MTCKNCGHEDHPEHDCSEQIEYQDGEHTHSLSCECSDFIPEADFIKFSKNWNNKLDNDFFTTVRLWSKEKEDYYFHLALDGAKIAILLNNKFKGYAKIHEYKVTTLREIILSPFLSFLDAGLNPSQFYELLKKMYLSKAEWKDADSIFIVLLLKKER